MIKIQLKVIFTSTSSILRYIINIWFFITFLRFVSMRNNYGFETKFALAILAYKEGKSWEIWDPDLWGRALS